MSDNKQVGMATGSGAENGDVAGPVRALAAERTLAAAMAATPPGPTPPSSPISAAGPARATAHRTHPTPDAPSSCG